MIFFIEYNKDSDIDQKEDNVRVYVPIDLNKDAILRKLDRIIYHYKESNEENESEFSTDVNMLIAQIEIYDQIWYVRHMPKEGCIVLKRWLLSESLWTS